MKMKMKSFLCDYSRIGEVNHQLVHWLSSQL